MMRMKKEVENTLVGHLKQYERFLKRIVKYYQISKNDATEALTQAFTEFLCIEELEDFVRVIKERKLAARYVT